MLVFFCGSLSVKSTQKSARQRTDLNNDQKFFCGQEHREGGVDNRGAVKRGDKRGEEDKKETRDKRQRQDDNRQERQREKEDIEASRE